MGVFEKGMLILFSFILAFAFLDLDSTDGYGVGVCLFSLFLFPPYLFRVF